MTTILQQAKWDKIRPKVNAEKVEVEPMASQFHQQMEVVTYLAQVDYQRTPRLHVLDYFLLEIIIKKIQQIK